MCIRDSLSGAPARPGDGPGVAGWGRGPEPIPTGVGSAGGRWHMSSSLHDDQRPIVLAAVRGLIEAARSERALLPASSAERQFYLGVDAAAREVLHQELGSSR